MNAISATVLVKNNERTLRKTLQALARFDEVLIYDNGSSDKSLEIAKSFPNVRVEQGPFLGFGKTYNLASKLAKNDWIVSIDSDEEATLKLVEEIHSLTLDPNTVWRIKRENTLFGKKVNFAGWADDYQVKLFNKKTTSFSNCEVHEKIDTKGLKVETLQGHLNHTPYLSFTDFEQKSAQYSSLFALQHKGKRTSSPCKAVLHALSTFFRCYILKKGIFGGFLGFFISYYNAQVCFYKYLKLWQSNLQKSL